VTPNMTLIQSLKTQDHQCKQRMDQYRKRTIHKHLERPLWSASPTAAHVTRICESILQQHYEQHDRRVPDTTVPLTYQI
jgi:hypothetical protein